MKIAIPVLDGKLATHFGHCPFFAILDVDPDQKRILERDDIAAPPHEPGLLPPWLAQHGVKLVIAGGMGRRALDLFAEQGIEVKLGAQPDAPEQIVMKHLNGLLQTGDNPCDH